MEIEVELMLGNHNHQLLRIHLAVFETFVHYDAWTLCLVDHEPGMKHLLAWGAYNLALGRLVIVPF